MTIFGRELTISQIIGFVRTANTRGAGACGIDDCLIARAANDLADEVERLTIERAAMLKALQRADIDCDNCRHGKDDALCKQNDYDCESCRGDCVCAECRDSDKWEWRGG